MTAFPEAIGEIAAGYDVVLCDIWGVVHDGCEAFAQSCAALAEWRATRGPVILISNSPRPSPGVIEQMDALGVPRASWSGVVTSGDVTRVLLTERAPGPAFVLGPGRDDPLYDGLDLAYAPVEDAAFISCTGLVEDETETPEDYRALLTVAAARRLDMICANPDIVVQRGARLIYCGGALAQLYEELGGRAIMAGKPHAPIYERCLLMADDLNGGPVNRARVLTIGDGVATDVAGANRQGLDVLFIGGGIHGSAAVSHDGRLDEAATRAALAASGASARYAMAALRQSALAKRALGVKNDAVAAAQGESVFLEDLNVGQSAELTRTVREEDLATFAAVTGDDNPVHLDEVFASTTSFGGRIAHGMLSAGYISAVIGTKLPGSGAIYLEQSLRFRRPVRIGDEVTARAEVTAIDAERARVTLATSCRVAGKVVVDGEATIMVPRRPG